MPSDHQQPCALQQQHRLAPVLQPSPSPAPQPPASASLPPSDYDSSDPPPQPSSQLPPHLSSPSAPQPLHEHPPMPAPAQHQSPSHHPTALAACESPQLACPDQLHEARPPAKQPRSMQHAPSHWQHPQLQSSRPTRP